MREKYFFKKRGFVLGKLLTSFSVGIEGRFSVLFYLVSVKSKIYFLVFIFFIVIKYKIVCFFLLFCLNKFKILKIFFR